MKIELFPFEEDVSKPFRCFRSEVIAMDINLYISLLIILVIMETVKIIKK